MSVVHFFLINVLLFKFISLYHVFFEKVTSPASASELSQFSTQNTQKGIFVFWREDGYQLDHSSWGNICIQPVWEVQVSYEVVRLLSQISI